jgi:hypothetical protein
MPHKILYYRLTCLMEKLISTDCWHLKLFAPLLSTTNLMPFISRASVMRLIYSLLTAAYFANYIHCAELCSYQFPVPQAHCDVSQTNVCCTNLGINTCCSFDGQDGTNTHLGGSISFDGLSSSQQGHGYSPSIPGGQGTCSVFLAAIKGNGCVAFTQNRAGSANYFNSAAATRRDTQCAIPDKATYLDESGMPRHIVIPAGNYSIVAQALKDKDTETLSLFDNFGMKFAFRVNT